MNRLWLAFVVVMVASFLVLGWIGTRIYQEMPPIPEKVVTTDGQTLIDTGDITAGQNVWQSMGGMEVGSIWGHGSYVAPDWTADWLHREAVFILDRWANSDHNTEFEKLDNEQQACRGYNSFYWRKFNCGCYPSIVEEINCYDCRK